MTVTSIGGVHTVISENGENGSIQHQLVQARNKRGLGELHRATNRKAYSAQSRDS
jgi:hypothetical protein